MPAPENDSPFLCGESMKPKFNEKYKGIRCRVCLVRESSSDEMIDINGAEDVYDLVKEELENADREILLSVMLTIKNQLIGVETVNIGSVHATIISARDLFKSAILANAFGIVICHNHPSGNLDPSRDDIAITKRLVDAGELLGIKVLDHLIISNRGYTSMRDHHQIPA
jgi:DNA repair protein RadC